MEEYDDFGNPLPREDRAIADAPCESPSSDAVEVVTAGDDTPGRGAPITPPIVVHRFEAAEHADPLPRPCGVEHMTAIAAAPSRVRSVAVVGALQHGKTSFVDMLLVAAHETLSLTRFRSAGETAAQDCWGRDSHCGETARHMDRTDAERRRGISLLAKPATLVLSDARGASCVLNVVDTPGHAELAAETAAGLELADGVLLVVDAAEGVTEHTLRLIAHAARRNLRLVLVLTKVERLIVELRLPPSDAHLKLRHTIDAVNTALGSHGGVFVTPLDGSVLFASPHAGWVFSLESYARVFLSRALCSSAPESRVEALSKRLWGTDWVYDAHSGAVRKSTPAARCAFVQLVLEPLYKIYGAVLSEERTVLEPLLLSVGVRLSSENYELDVRPMLRRVFGHFFGGHDAGGAYGRALAAMLSQSVVPSVFAHVPVAVGSASAPLCARVVKLLPRIDGTVFDAVVRVDNGVLLPRSIVHVHRYPNPDASDNGPPMVFEVGEVAFAGGRDRVPVPSVPAGCWALVPGLCVPGVVTSVGGSPPVTCAPHPPQADECAAAPVVRVALEPLVPGDAPAVDAGIASVALAHRGVSIERGKERALLGPGELALDAALYDLRRVFAHVDVRVADPVAVLRETCAATSRVPCGWSFRVGDALFRVAVIAEPIGDDLADALENSALRNLRDSLPCGESFNCALTNFLRNPKGVARWDALASRSVLAFGPDDIGGTCALLDDTLLEDQRALVLAHAPALVAGFRRATHSGPLIGERVHGVRFRITSLETLSAHTNGASDSAEAAMLLSCHGALLTATPCIAEPIVRGEIRIDTRHAGAADAVTAVLARRRGHVLAQTGVPATPSLALHVMLPAMDSFGLEADVRLATAGASAVQVVHACWRAASGDPLDTSIRLVPLAPAPGPVLGRDYLLKTRRRKHMPDGVSVLDLLDSVSRSELSEMLSAF